MQQTPRRGRVDFQLERGDSESSSHGAVRFLRQTDKHGAWEQERRVRQQQLKRRHEERKHFDTKERRRRPSRQRGRRQQQEQQQQQQQRWPSQRGRDSGRRGVLRPSRQGASPRPRRPRSQSRTARRRHDRTRSPVTQQQGHLYSWRGHRLPCRVGREWGSSVHLDPRMGVASPPDASSAGKRRPPPQGAAPSVRCSKSSALCLVSRDGVAVANATAMALVVPRQPGRGPGHGPLRFARRIERTRNHRARQDSPKQDWDPRLGPVLRGIPCPGCSGRNAYSVRCLRKTQLCGSCCQKAPIGPCGDWQRDGSGRCHDPLAPNAAR